MSTEPTSETVRANGAVDVDEADDERAAIIGESESTHANGAAHDAEPSEDMQRVRVVGPSWESLLLHKQFKGKPTNQLRPVAANVTLILEHDPRWAEVIAYDEFAEDVVSLKPAPWRACDTPQGGAAAGDWTPDDLTRIQAWLATEYGIDVGPDALMSAVHVVAKRRRIHPVRDWLTSLRWDGVPRLDTWLTDIMGAKDTPYVRAVGRAWAVSAVARIYRPGCKVDTVLVLEGKPGTFKSSVLRALVGDEWFFEMSVTDVSNKDAMQVLRRKWIAEFPEIDSLSRYEQANVKSYFSRQVDRYRPSFGKGAADYPRQTTFAATTNKSEWITDETGGTGRRMWPTWCERGDVALAREMREQFWAEARARYESGEAWHITDPALLDAERLEQSARLQSDAWEPIVAAWLQNPTRMAEDEGFNGKPVRTRVSFTIPDEGVTTAEVLEHALEIPKGRITKADNGRAAAVLRAVGWARLTRVREDGVRVRRYAAGEP